VDSRPQILDEMIAALEALLAALGGNGAEGRGVALDAALVRSDVAYLRLREAQALSGPSPGSSSEEMQKKVDSFLRLQALVQSVAADALNEVGLEREKIAQVRVALRQHVPQEVTGNAGSSCDVRG
jgi:hypothetical protein